MSNDAWSWLSLADMESMVLNMGVVSALMLSFCVGVFSTVPAEETAFGDYRFAMLGLPAFRTFAVEVLETEGFNFNHPVPGRAVPLDIRSALTKATDFDVIESTLHPPANGYCVFNGPFSACTQDVKDIADAIVLTWDAFPAKYIDVFFHAHPDARVFLLGTSESARLSDRLNYWATLTQMLLAIPLFISVFMHIALTASPIRENQERFGPDGPGGPEEDRMQARVQYRRFVMLSSPLLAIGMVSNAGALVIFFESLMQLNRIRSPSWSWAQSYRTIYMSVIYPGVFVPLAVSGVAFFLAGGGHCLRERKIAVRPA